MLCLSSQDHVLTGTAAPRHYIAAVLARDLSPTKHLELTARNPYQRQTMSVRIRYQRDGSPWKTSSVSSQLQLSRPPLGGPEAAIASGDAADCRALHFRARRGVRAVRADWCMLVVVAGSGEGYRVGLWRGLGEEMALCDLRRLATELSR